ncbi:hypothetical protein [Pseudorhodoplanes sp.]|uniref:hypothetical protein n=1 Tax=Pseudorhodoplanes sp. TaxID=1934341 RepID=UPI002BD28E0A|nr:hypothetical protein [Pseudorhodoplanes sp.]HWV55351.1 hypothetical protein [Pseudorhodoplanes sp.]
MHSSFHIARLMGPVMTVIGLGLVTNPGAYREITQQIVSYSLFVYFSGILAMVTGLAILNTHNVWTRDWRVIITVIGLILTCIGVFRVIAPPYVAYLGGAVFAYAYFHVVCGVLFLAVGGFITFKGYAAYDPDPAQGD